MNLGNSPDAAILVCDWMCHCFLCMLRHPSLSLFRFTAIFLNISLSFFSSPLLSHLRFLSPSFSTSTTFYIFFFFHVSHHPNHSPLPRFDSWAITSNPFTILLFFLFFLPNGLLLASTSFPLYSSPSFSAFVPKHIPIVLRLILVKRFSFLLLLFNIMT